MKSMSEQGLHPGAPAPGTARYAAAVITAILAAATVAVVLWLVARYWPYENFSAEPETVEEGGAQLVGYETTNADGTPVIPIDASGIFFDSVFCNPGYDLTIERWFDFYPELEKDGDPSLSYLFRLQEANVPDRICPVEAPVPVTLPDDLPPGTYRLRVVYRYQPNAFAPMRTEVVETEQFVVTE